MTKSVMIVGVGGQGSLLASKILGRVLTGEGYDVKVSEVHGMSQRGGSVVTYVKFGERVFSPIVDLGEADYIVSFEKLEAARYAPYLKKGGRIVVNTQEIDPMPVINGTMTYPSDVLDRLAAAGITVPSSLFVALPRPHPPAMQETMQDPMQDRARFLLLRRLYAILVPNKPRNGPHPRPPDERPNQRDAHRSARTRRPSWTKTVFCIP